MQDLQASIQHAERESADIERQLAAVREQTRVEQLELAKHEERVLNLRSNHDRLVQDQALCVQQEDEAQRRLVAGRDGARQTELRILATGSAVADLALVAEDLAARIAQLTSRDRELRLHREQLRLQEDRLHGARRDVTDRDHACEIQLRDVRHQMDTLAARLEEEYQLALPDLVAGGASACRGWLEARGQKSEVGGQRSQNVGVQASACVREPEGRSTLGGDAQDGADNVPADVPTTGVELLPAAEGPAASGDGQSIDLSFEVARAELDEEVQRLRRKLKLMGNVNTDALRDLDELEARHTEMSSHLQDLQEARTALEDIIRRINVESRRLFLESFEAIRGHFRELFRKLFGGGEADIILEDPADVLECGIDIVARPPGKELRSISLLSGGEKTLTAVALLFAMFKSKPSPYCILDEVDASLDEANVDRYVSLVRDFTSMTQFVVITHRKPTMAAAHVLYGVTMEQAGVSKRMSVRFEDVKENGEIRTRGGRAA
jgi:chromosome segregation protein